MDMWLPPKPAIIRPAPKRKELWLPPRRSVPTRRGMLYATPYIGLGAGGEQSPLAQVDSSTSTAATIVAPTTIVPGDLLILVQYSFDAGGSAAVTPTGFTNFINVIDVGGGSRGMIDWRLADGSEAGATLTGMDEPADAKVLVVYRRAPIITSVTPLGAGSESTTGNPVAQTVGSASGAVPLIVIGGYGATAPVSPRTFTVSGVSAKDGEVGAGVGTTDAWQAWKIYEVGSTPDDVVIDMDDEGTNALMSGYFQVS